MTINYLEGPFTNQVLKCGPVSKCVALKMQALAMSSVKQAHRDGQQEPLQRGTLLCDADIQSRVQTVLGRAPAS